MVLLCLTNCAQKKRRFGANLRSSEGPLGLVDSEKKKLTNFVNHCVTIKIGLTQKEDKP
jgi:hypothetical protein